MSDKGKKTTQQDAAIIALITEPTNNYDDGPSVASNT